MRTTIFSNNKNNDGVEVTSSLNTLSTFSLWSRCTDYLHEELSNQQFNTWIKPLSVDGIDSDLTALSDDMLVLRAPNRFIKNWVASKFQSRLSELARLLSSGQVKGVTLDVEASSIAPLQNTIDQMPTGDLSSSQPVDLLIQPHHHRSEPNGFINDAIPSTSLKEASVSGLNQAGIVEPESAGKASADSFSNEAMYPKISFGSERHGLNQAGALETISSVQAVANETYSLPSGPNINHGAQQQSFLDKREITKKSTASHQNNILDRYRFDNLVEGKSNQMALAAAKQVVENPSTSYNPLFLYGGVGLGKTHLMHAVGNEIKRRKPNAKVVYLHSERFVGDMVKALQLNAIDDFKRYYRSVDALLIDDIQFFAGKDRSQEEFFHTFNALLEGGHQMIFSCDRYPKSINGIEERLKSRFGWGLTVQIEPPELEMRVAILKRKAEQEGIDIPNDAAFFLAQRVRANGRDLEGALKRVYANSQFQNKPITVELVKESLSDLLALQDKMVTIDNIQKTAAEYFKIKLSDLLSKRRNRSLARPRQIAMSLAKELTRHSLPEIGDAFGGRDHTTVLHACRKVKELRDSSHDVSEDYRNLVRLLST